MPVSSKPNAAVHPPVPDEASDLGLNHLPIRGLSQLLNSGLVAPGGS
ncbi:MAG: hypothetical protein MJA27_25120 [Pseudanabaenales cyanobacterium]|nr:hypothetical protein [Pseudanabaenales cyanobacterium]